MMENMEEAEEANGETVYCLVCDTRLFKTSRGIYNIFEETTVLPYSHEQLGMKLSTILGSTLNNGEVPSEIVCKKCYKLLEAVDGLEWTLQEHRTEINNKYKKSCQARVLNSEEPRLMSDGEMQNDDEDDWNDEDGENDWPIDPTTLTSSHLGVKEEQDGVERKFLQMTEEDKLLKVRVMKMKQKRKMALTRKKNLLKPFCCPVCQKRFSYKRYVTEHLKVAHKGENIYKCEACNDTFRHKGELSKHVAAHERMEDPQFNCELCGKRFHKHKQFQEHKRFHESKMFSCELCDKVFSSGRLLEEHMNVHTGARPHVCHICSKSFASSQCYRVHLKTHDDRPRPYSCDICSKSFMKHVHLQSHLKIHNPEGEYQCNICMRKFNTKRNLDSHQVVHSTERPFICRTCGKSFTRKYQLRIHERLHTGIRPYVCDICGTAFAQHSNLSTHKKLTHEQICKFRCPHCNKAYKRRRLVKWHIMAAHTGEKPLVCQTCGAGFVYPEHLKKHMRIHTGEKPYSCRTCGRTFSSKENRDMHEFIHTDVKPYQCAICSQGFMRKPLLLAHISSVHHIEAQESHIVRNSLSADHLKSAKAKHKPQQQHQVPKPQAVEIQQQQVQVTLPTVAHQQLPAHSSGQHGIQIQNMTLDMSMHGQYQGLVDHKTITTDHQGALTAGKLHYVLQGGAVTLDQSGKATRNLSYNPVVVPGGTVLMPAVSHQQMGVAQHITPQSQFIQVELPKGFPYTTGTEITQAEYNN